MNFHNDTNVSPESLQRQTTLHLDPSKAFLAVQVCVEDPVRVRASTVRLLDTINTIEL